MTDYVVHTASIPLPAYSVVFSFIGIETLCYCNVFPICVHLLLFSIRQLQVFNGPCMQLLVLEGSGKK